MAFGNPYGDPWNEDEVCEAVEKLAAIRIRSISLADTVGVAGPDLIHSMVQLVTKQHADYDIGVHLHSAPDTAAANVLASYDSDCRSFAYAMAGLGGSPFAHDALARSY